jgi:hypothetical protein
MRVRRGGDTAVSSPSSAAEVSPHGRKGLATVGGEIAVVIPI